MYQGLGLNRTNIMADALATGLFVSLCTIQDPPTDISPDGSLPLNVDADWTDVLVGIRCMNAPLGFKDVIQANELKMPNETLALGPRHVLLEGCYPSIHSGQRAVIDGVAHDILGAESDSQRVMTRLYTRVADLSGVASL